MAATVHDRSDHSRRHLPTIALLVALLAGSAGAAGSFGNRGGGPGWRTIGHDSRNSRNQPFERAIGPATAGRLAVKWAATTAGGAPPTPAVVRGAVCFGDFGGIVLKIGPPPMQRICAH